MVASKTVMRVLKIGFEFICLEDVSGGHLFEICCVISAASAGGRWGHPARKNVKISGCFITRVKLASGYQISDACLTSGESGGSLKWPNKCLELARQNLLAFNGFLVIPFQG
jgi:hypothetical protein